MNKLKTLQEAIDYFAKLDIEVRYNSIIKKYYANIEGRNIEGIYYEGYYEQWIEFDLDVFENIIRISIKSYP
jgi:hypothetical protein